MIAGDLIKYLEEWAPPGAAWKGDNVGLQIGSRWNKIKAIFLCLELNEKTLDEAISRKCNFILTHHPLIFKPLKSITPDHDTKSRLIETLIKKNISLYSAHTNLDFTRDGVNFELAKTLGLKNIEFLEHEKGNQIKLVLFAPQKSLDVISEAIFSAGGGIIGEYTKCSYRLDGIGTFEGSSNTNPVVGKKGAFEKINEVRLEVLVDEWNLEKVVSAMLKAHPYEEPAYDIYKLENSNVNFGSGAIGKLAEPLSTNDFLELVRTKLNTKQVRYCSGKKKKVRRIAVHGGSISDSLYSALTQRADALVTADIKYHTFEEAEGRILLIDAGHYETEIQSLKGVKKKIENFLSEKKSAVKVFRSTQSTNPIRIYNYKGV